MSLIRIAYFGSAGLIGGVFHTREKYIDSNRKAGSMIYSLSYGLFYGVPTGMVCGVVFPILAFFSLCDEGESYFAVKERE